MFNNEKLGAFIVPTGIGASIGGFAGDASLWAREFSKKCRLMVNPNVVNAGGFSGINDKMLYVEGYSLDEFFKGNINLKPSQNNKIGIVFDKSISKEVLNIHINTMNAVKTVYGVDIIGYEITDEDVGVEFYVDSSEISTGTVKNIDTVVDSAKRLINNGAEAIAIVCRFEDEDNDNYANGIGVDPVGGVEAVISHYVSKELKVPCAHSPAFDDYSISTEIVDGRAASEYITPTFLPCILLGLSNAPKLTGNCDDTISINDLDFLVMPADSLGSVPVLECVQRGVDVYAVQENKTVLNVTSDLLFQKSGIINIESYKQCLELI